MTIRFQAIASAPVLRTKVFKISSSQRFETVVGFLRRRLEVGVGEGVFCYVNSVFAPGLDEGVGGLWRVSFWRGVFLLWVGGGWDEEEVVRGVGVGWKLR